MDLRGSQLPTLGKRKAKSLQRNVEPFIDDCALSLLITFVLISLLSSLLTYEER